MPTLFNPTTKIIPCMHGGMSARFMPGEKKEIFDGYAAKHLVNRWGKDGLVDISFGPKDAERFSSYEEYVHAQALVGLATWVQTLERGLRNFEYYFQETKDKDSPEKGAFKGQYEIAKKELEAAKAHASAFSARNPSALTPTGREKLAQEIARLQQKLDASEGLDVNDKGESEGCSPN